MMNHAHLSLRPVAKAFCDCVRYGHDPVGTESNSPAQQRADHPRPLQQFDLANMPDTGNARELCGKPGGGQHGCVHVNDRGTFAPDQTPQNDRRPSQPERICDDPRRRAKALDRRRSQYDDPNPRGFELCRQGSLPRQNDGWGKRP